MTDYLIPRPNSALSQNGMPPTKEWYNFLRGLYELYKSSDSSVQSQITSLAYKLGSPDGTIANIPIQQILKVQGIDSIVSNGLNVVQLSLDGDVLNASALTFYGALDDNSKGWQPYSSNFQKTTAGGVGYLDLVDLADDGTGTFKLLTRDSKGRLQGTLDGAASDVPSDNSSFEIVSGSNVQDNLESIDSTLVNEASTGLYYGGELSSLGASTGSVSAGAGQILDNSDPQNPIFHKVTWSSASGIALADGLTWAYVDDTGTVQTTTTEPSHDAYRTEIQLGRWSVTSGVITGIAHNLVMTQQYGPQMWDLWRALPRMKRDLPLTASGANLKVKIGAGEIYGPGINFHDNPENPSEIDFPIFDTAGSDRFKMLTQTGIIDVDVADLPVASYDVSGTVTAIPGSGNRATIMPVYRFVSGNVRIAYGQTYYNSLTEAIDALGRVAPVIPPGFDEAAIVGYYIVTKGCTSLADPATCLIVTTNNFGGLNGGVATSGIIPLSTDDLPEGSTNIYFTNSRVRLTTLTGLSTSTATNVTSSDSVLVGIGKLQAQATANSSAISGKLSNSGDTGNGDYTFNGWLTTAKTSGNVYNFISSPSGNLAGLFFSTLGSPRWIFSKSSVAEGSGNSGSDLTLIGYDNSGVSLGLRLSISRSNGNVTPGSDNSQTFGSGALRWSVIYAGTGTINTSDAREKSDVSILSEAEIAASIELSREVGGFQFLSAVDAKGGDARIHIGMTVQRAMEIMHNHGLDPLRYGFICHDTWGASDAVYDWLPGDFDEEGKVKDGAQKSLIQPAREAGDRYGFRTDELNLFIAKGAAEERSSMKKQIDAMQEKIDTLMAKLIS